MTVGHRAVPSGMGSADTIIAAVAAGLSGVAAVASWRSSAQANATAEAVARIERDRWHLDLTPQLRLKLEPQGGMLYVRFDGPASLGRITVQLTVRDDRDRVRDPVLAGGPTAEERAEVVWGPYHFRPGVDGADQLGPSVTPFTLEADDRTRLAVDESLRPRWYEGTGGEEQWRQQNRTKRMRLWADCTAAGHKPWKLSFEVPQDGTWARTGQPVGT